MARFFRTAGVADQHLHHEPVDLRFGQRIGAFLFQRILRRQHQKRIGQGIGLIADGDLAFLHGFQERALHFRRRAIDLIRENEIAEDRTPAWCGRRRPGGCRSWCRQYRPGSMSGVNCRALEAHGNRTGQGFSAKVLANPGTPSKRTWPVGEQRDQQPVQQMLLTDDDARHLHLQRPNPPRIVQNRLARGAQGRHRTRPASGAIPGWPQVFDSLAFNPLWQAWFRNGRCLEL